MNLKVELDYLAQQARKKPGYKQRLVGTQFYCIMRLRGSRVQWYGQYGALSRKRVEGYVRGRTKPLGSQ